MEKRSSNKNKNKNKNQNQNQKNFSKKLFDREFLHKKYGIPYPQQQKSHPPSRSNERVRYKGRGRGRGSNIHVLKISKERRKNPSLPYPPITPEDLSKGIHSLIERGLIPEHEMDLTEIISSYPSPVTTAPAKFHTVEEKSFLKRKVMTKNDVQNIFENVKYDLVTVYKKQLPMRKEIPKRVHVVDMVINGLRKKRKKDDDDDDEGKGKGKGIEKDEEIRKYSELMDTFSSHHAIIRRGKILAQTEEFLSFQRCYKDNWGPIVSLLKELERIMLENDVPIAFVDGKRVVRLAEDSLEMPSRKKLLVCVINYDEVIKQLNRRCKRYEGENGKVNAAISIQKTWRMYKAIKTYKFLVQREKSAVKIQQQWLLRKNYFRTREKIKKALEIKGNEWRKKMEYFKKDWNDYKKKKRLIIHLPSISCSLEQRLSFHKYKLFENAQMARLLDLVDENVEILYVSPFKDSEESLNYIFNILKEKGINDYESRINIVSPEHIESFPDHISLSRALLYSPRTMTYIKTKALGRRAYIVAGKVGEEEYKISIKLGIPLLGPDPVKSLLYCEKSGSKTIFQIASVNIPISEINIHEETDIILHLSKKIIEFPQKKVWILKVNNEFSSRGIAFIEVSSIRCLSVSERERLYVRLKNKGLEHELLDHLRDRVYFELRDNIDKKMKIVSTHVYSNWEAILKAVKKFGCVIEEYPNNIVGYPVVNLLIEPSGEIVVESIQEQLSFENFTVVAHVYPQTIVPDNALIDASKSIGRVLFQKGVIGYCSIEYVAFLTQGKHLKILGMDMKLHLTNHALYHKVFQFVTSNDKNLYYIYSSIINHSSFKFWRHENFIQKCRRQGILFDYVQKKGVVFQILDNIMKGSLGALSIGYSKKDIVSYLRILIILIQSSVVDNMVPAKITNESNLVGITKVLKMILINEKKSIK